ncbi:MAG: dockerin type I repeat-containing protein, partial [bacterium]
CDGTEAHYYLDMMYILDPSAGGIVQNEGYWQQADVMWARLGCVNEVEGPILNYQPLEVGWPTWTKHGRELALNLRVENNGNSHLVFDMKEFETTKSDDTSINWLQFDPPNSADLPAGLSNTRDYTVKINYNGIINFPGTVVRLHGGIAFTSNAATSPDTFHIDVVVADTVYPPEVDTISTSCISLVISNNSSIGNGGAGLVNMDYVNNGDCDPNAKVYLNSGSSVLGWIRGPDTTMNWSVFGNDYRDTTGFVQMTNTDKYMEGNYEAYTAKVLNNDSSMIIEKTWFAPQGTDPNECNFIIQRIRLYDNGDKNGSNAQSNLIFGEVIDWDIPSDTGSRNGSGFDDDKMTIWQYGSYYADTSQTTVYPCAPLRNTSRYGGMNFLTMYKWNGVSNTSVTDSYGGPIHNAFTIDNATYVYRNDNGFNASQLCSLMVENIYFSIYSSSVPESTYTDLYTTMTFVDNLTLNAGETLNVWVALFTTPIGSNVGDINTIVNESRDRFCEDFFPGNMENPPYFCTCCERRGDYNHNGIIDTSDPLFLLSYLFEDYGPPACWDEGNVNGDNDNLIDLSDYAYLMNIINNGYMPFDCRYLHPIDTQTGVSISLLSVDGSIPFTDTLLALSSIKFHINIENNASDTMDAISNGFRIYSPTGAHWNTTTGVYKDDFGSHYEMYMKSRSITGSGADTIWFGGTNFNNSGLPIGFDDTAFVINIGPISDSYGGHIICLDTAWYPTVHAWLWSSADASHRIIPSWDGPHCYYIKSSKCCNHDGIRGDVTGDGSILVNDLVFLVNYMFKGGAQPSCIAEGDANGDGDIYVNDLTLLVNYLFKGGLPPVACPE